MALIVTSNHLMIYARGNTIHFYDWEKELKRFKISLPPVEEKAKDEPHKPDTRIDFLNVSKCGTFLSVCDNFKNITILNKVQSHEWKVVNTRLLAKRCNICSFTTDNKFVIVADRTGDVYQYPTEAGPQDKQRKPILGHLSTIIGMIITEDGFIVTADRDEKIRVSYLNHAYDIVSFCLGHKEFVSCLQLIPSFPKLLISGSGDGTVRAWNYKTGKMLSVRKLIDDFGGLDRNEEIADEFETNKHDNAPIMRNCDEFLKIRLLQSSSTHSVIAVACEEFNCVNIYSIKEKEDESVDINLIERLACDAADFSFDPSGNLWVLCYNSESILKVYQPVEISDSKIKFKLYEEKNGGSLAEFINSIQDDLNGAEIIEKEGSLKSYYKRWFDNVDEYKKRKNERLDEKSKKLERKKLKINEAPG